MKRLVIVGAGAQARYGITTVQLTGSHRVAGLIDTFDNKAMWGTEVLGHKVLGALSALPPPADDLELLLAVSSFEQKEKLATSLAAKGYRFATVIHPTAVIASDVKPGAGSLINAGVVVENGSKIGAHVILHAGVVVEHDNVLGDFVNFGPGVVTAGRVQVGRGAVVYTGASVVPDVKIAEGAVVGAGSVVLADVGRGATVVGVPARPISGKS